MLHVTKFIFGAMHPLKKQFEFVTSVNIKSSTNCSHLKRKFWNYICLDRMFLDEENIRLPVRLKKKKKGGAWGEGEEECVLFMSVIIHTAAFFDSCSRRTVNSWRTHPVSDAGPSLGSEHVFSQLLSSLPALLQIC